MYRNSMKLQTPKAMFVCKDYSWDRKFDLCHIYDTKLLLHILGRNYLTNLSNCIMDKAELISKHSHNYVCVCEREREGNLFHL